jgi:heme/copper-type cytochrome/quinol oxidase subunit 2
MLGEEREMNTQVSETGEKAISVVNWLGTILVAFVPLINIIVLFYWSLGRDIDPNRRNFSRAGLIVIGILTVLILSVFYYMIISIDPHERIKAFMIMD